MSLVKKGGNDDEGSAVIVAVKASHEISRCALAWALTNVVQSGDRVRLLVVIPAQHHHGWLWEGLHKLHIAVPKLHMPRFHSDCTHGHGHTHMVHWNSMMAGNFVKQKDYITKVCTEMMSDLWETYDPQKVRLKMKVVYGGTHGVVASEAKKARSQWVVLDNHMKEEAKSCMEQLDCNVVIVRHSGPKVLRLNLIEQSRTEPEVVDTDSKCTQNDFGEWKATKVPNVTPTGSPEHKSVGNTPERASSMSSMDLFNSPKFISEINWEPKAKKMLPSPPEEHDFDRTDTESDSDNLSSFSASVSSQQWIEDNMSSADEGLKHLKRGLRRSHTKTPSSISEVDGHPNYSRNMREIISLNKKSPADSPPLCTVCRHKSPSFGLPPKSFSYSELEQATCGFSQDNFLAEGGYGSVYRGVLPDGQFIAVKQHKAASSQGDREFCAEVHALSCAQHRNVVMLIGYCVEDERQMLVYEYICNGSLDSHLYGRDHHLLDWAARQRIAVGASRGLSYLHEECRVGCIVHRDMRPNNILLTHDFEPLVGDFGLARLQPDRHLTEETRVIGTFGYLAPEYAQTGQICEKADVYSFGVVLVELITGRKAVDINRPKGEQCLTLWARSLLENNEVSKLVDPRLVDYSEKEVQAMVHCASLCLQRDPELRPRMSQVHRLLEGDVFH